MPASFTTGATGTERQTTRLEAFNDAVLAIAITLPVVQIELPAALDDHDLRIALAGMWREFLAYVLSFTAIGVYWATSHNSGKIFEKTDHSYNLLNLVYLAAVSLLPLPARLLAMELGHEGAALAARILALGLLVPELVWTLKWMYARRARLYDPRLAPTYLRHVTLRNVCATLTHALAVALCSWDARAGLSLSALAMGSYLVAPARPHYLPGQQPRTEIEEPDERPR